MSDFNKVIMVGRLCRDPEMRQVGSTPKTTIRLAASREWKGRDGDNQKATCYVDAECWARTAEVVKQYFQKGDPILIEGSLDYQEWEKDGQNRSKHVIRVDRFNFLPKGRDQGGGGYQGGGSQGYGRDQGGYQPAPQGQSYGGDADVPF